MNRPFSLERNLALMAGAGTGKTHRLLTLCLHLLGGAGTHKAPLRAGELCLLTFTDKAASELRERLYARLDALASRGGARGEPELSASFEAEGKPFPNAAFWRACRDELGASFIGTFHSLCAQLLRKAPLGAGFDASFRLLEEREARELLLDCAERCILTSLEGKEEGTVELCRELGFGSSLFVKGLAGFLCEVYGKLREEGLSPEGLPLGDEVEALREFEEGVTEASRLLHSASGLDLKAGGSFAEPLRRCAFALDGMSAENFLEAGRRDALLSVASELRRVRGKDELSCALRELKWALEGKEAEVAGLSELLGGVLSCRREASFRSLLSTLKRRHAEALSARAALDFTELLLRARDLLRGQPAFRKEMQGKLGALLVDEFQDTNRVQLELLLLLAEQREGGPRQVLGPKESLRSRPDEGAVEAGPLRIAELPLEPGLLCAVGDRKQSIYEFRGADVSIFGELSSKIEREGGARFELTTNRRSTPELLSFFNGLFSKVMAPGTLGKEYEVAYQPPLDDLSAHRLSLGLQPAVERLVCAKAKDSEEGRRAEAEAVARRVHQLLHSGFKIERQGERRLARGGDIALLFRRFVYVEVYRQALARYGIAHRLVRGRGFYGAQEVMDIASLLSTLCRGHDALSAVAVLRSPMVALSDGALLRLSRALAAPPSFAKLHSLNLEAVEFAAPERERLSRFLVLHRQLAAQRDLLGVAAVVRVALEETRYALAVSGAPFGEQALANLDKLLSLASQREKQGADCRSFAAELLELAETEPAEAQADVLDVQDTRAVSLLTIHQSKGLEWPIVFVPDMGSMPRSPSDRVMFDRAWGLGIKCQLDGQSLKGRGPRLAGISRELLARQSAEQKRLLYVALTRARDFLVLSGQPSRRADSWHSMLDTHLRESAELRAQVCDVDAASLPRPKPPPPPQGELGVEGADEVEALLTRVRNRPAPTPKRLIFPATALLEFIGASERRASPRVSFDGGAEAPDVRTQGTLAHGVLQRLDFSLVGTAQLAPEVLRILWNLGAQGEVASEVTPGLLAYLQSDFVRKLKEPSPSAQLYRELPFLLRLGERGATTLYLKGQMDFLRVDSEGEGLLLDYKWMRRQRDARAAHRLQLGAYALAAQGFIPACKKLSAGIVFLKEKNPGPDIEEPFSLEDLDALRERLMQAAFALWTKSVPGEGGIPMSNGLSAC